MAKNKNKDFKKQLNQAIRDADNPWEMQQKVRQHLQTMGVNHANPGKYSANDIPDYDINTLMNKIGDKMPPGIKQMLDQFIPIIPTPGAMGDPHFKKEMKKKMKNFRSVFKSPYE